MLPNSPPGAVMLVVGVTKVPPLPDCWTAGLLKMLIRIPVMHRLEIEHTQLEGRCVHLFRAQ